MGPDFASIRARRAARTRSRSVPVLALGPDGRLLTGGGDRTARVWMLDVPSLLDVATAVAGRELSTAEWEECFAGEPYRPTLPVAGTGRG